MKNEECTIYFKSKHGKIYQSFRKEKNGWTQTSSRGIVRPCTAEQMTTHILILFVLILFIFSIIFPRQDMLVLTVVFVIVVGAFILSTKNKIKLWKKKWNK